MFIRKITSGDNKAVAKIIRTSLEEFKANKPGTAYFDKTTDHLSEVFTITNAAYYVIEVDGKIVGSGGFYPTEGLPAGTCELVKMYLTKECRGKGWGNLLLNKCMDEAKKQGYQKMYLESMPELVNAIGMYKKNGFQPIPHSLGNSGHTGCDIWMMREL